jgi:hypothetical protein
MEPLTNPFTYRLTSKLPYSIQVTLSIPEDEECPLTLESIEESKLPCLDAPFILDRPLHKMLTLPCGHKFSAMTLIYSFCKNNMKCPCCRAGKEVQADTGCLPIHIKSRMKEHIQQTLDIESRLDDAIEQQEIRGFVGALIPYHSMENVSLVANFYDSMNSRLILSLNTMMQSSRVNGRTIMVPRGHMRAWAHIAHMGLRYVQLSVQFSFGTTHLTIGTSSISRLPTEPTNTTILADQGEFRMRFSENLTLETISWSPANENMEM